MLLVSHEGAFATGSEEAGLQEHSKAAGFPLFQCLATALSIGVYRYSNRKKTILCLLPPHPLRLFSSALPEFK